MTKTLIEDLTPIAFDSAEEFRARLDYLPALRCTPDDLDRIVGKYSFSKQNELPCGLNGCNTKHQNGYVIRTKDGRETHCGNKCGWNAFGVNFEEVEATFKTAWDRLDKAQRLQRVLNDRNEYLSRAKRIYDEGSQATTVVQFICQQVEKDVTFKRAFNDCIRNQGRILVADEASRALKKDMGTSGAKADLKMIGVLHGIGVLATGAIPLKELKYKVIVPLQELTQESLEGLSLKAMTAKSESFGQIKQTISSAEQYLRECNQFLAPENLQTFSLLQECIPPKARWVSRISPILDAITKAGASMTKAA